MLLQDFCFRDFAPPEQQLQSMGRHIGDCRMGKIRESVGEKKKKKKKKGKILLSYSEMEAVKADSV